MSKKEFYISGSEQRTDEETKKCVEEAYQLMEKIYDQGCYVKLKVQRPWSEHNPVTEGEFAKPKTFKAYLVRELTHLVSKGASITVSSSRKTLSVFDPSFLEALDESTWDFSHKKLFLFQPERIELSVNRLEHYTGTKAEDFQKVILFTNYNLHMEAFLRKFPDCIRPEQNVVQMPAYHHKLEGKKGISIVNIGVGPSNAKTFTDHVAVLRPDAFIMVGHCGGLRNHQDIGDFVLASGYMRGDKILDEIMPKNVPITPHHLLNEYLEQALTHFDLPYRVGTVYTTDDRNWEFSKKRVFEEIRISRSIAIDMESSTIATNGFRYRIPTVTLLCVSDKPLHGRPKLQKSAQEFYQNSKERHLDVVFKAIELSQKDFPLGFAKTFIRGFYEPIFAG